MANKKEYQGKMVNTIDLTPTWESLIRVMLQLTEEGKLDDGLKGEFIRMAQAADKWNAYVKRDQRGQGF